MKTGIMQPYFFPYIGYWQLINAVDTFVIFDDVNYIKKGYINRNSILVGGHAKQFTLELVKASQNKLINEIKVGNNTNKILKTLEMTYKKAPYFKIVSPIIVEILTQEEKNLARFLGYSLEKISSYLQIETKLIYSSHLEKDNSHKAQEKIIDICKKTNTSSYINAIGGQKIYHKERFKKEKIELNFIKTELIEYTQFKNEFVPFLSIIDIMMFNSVDTIKQMLAQYKLTEECYAKTDYIRQWQDSKNNLSVCKKTV
ncbi:MAG: WbqC family protein [gamma proteobacterium symbiont of Taylorina sp.]|nr:WbqC family protein [gamma proteobacterium symbiont of Taylorina sp.]